MDNVCNRCLFSIPSKVEMAEEQEYLRSLFRVWEILHFVSRSSTSALRQPIPFQPTHQIKFTTYYLQHHQSCIHIFSSVPIFCYATLCLYSHL